MAITEVVNVKFKEGRSTEVLGKLLVSFHSIYQKVYWDLDGVLHLDVDIGTRSRPLFSTRAPTDLLSLPAYHYAYLLHEVSTTLLATHLNLDPQINYSVTHQIASHATRLLMAKAQPFGYSIKAELELLRLTDNDDEEDVDYGTCSVCLEDFSTTVGSKMVVTDCSHFYHASCLLPWLMRQNTCPTCRHRVVE